MVWSRYAILMSGKTDSIKINNNSGCLPGSTFVYREVFKFDFFLQLLYSILVTIHPSSIMRKISWYARHASLLVLVKSSYSFSLIATYSSSCPNEYLNISNLLILQIGTDKTKIPRNTSNYGQTRTQEQKSTKEAGKLNKEKKYKPLLIGTFGFMEGELVMEELPWTSLAYLRISQSCECSY
ncbi:hypothetical protein Tco_0724928 [Tanacetum coccineum]|uniref:Uncharacterized protein n=1 Tax=Tanacetum coccineum TaxID=301880 RepID=A0ABQ4YCC1_9ASTR